MKQIFFPGWILLFISSSAVCQSWTSADASLSFKHYQIEQGLSDNTIYCSLQDHYGFLWFGTKNGVNRFDGYHFRNTQLTQRMDSIAHSNRVLSLFEDAQRQLWLGGEAGLYRYDIDREKIRLVAGSVSFISGIVQDRQQKIWFVGGADLYSYDTREEKLRKWDHNRYFEASTLQTGSEGEVWIGSVNGRIYRYREEKDSFDSVDLYASGSKAKVGTPQQRKKFCDKLNKNWYARERGSGIKRFILGTEKNWFMHTNIACSRSRKGGRFLIPLLCTFFLFFHATLFAQNPFTISGHVTDSAGNPLEKASVRIAGKNRGTGTGSSGQFSLQVTSGDVLQLSAVGYESRDLTVTSPGQSFELVLRVRNQSLGEVVVVGYGTQRKADVTGAVASLKPADFNKGVIVSPQALILGKAPGVRVVAGGGEPGAGLSVSVRGAGSITAGSDPLYVVDGVPLQNAAPVGDGGPGFSSAFTPRSPLSSINPSDILSIDILKDASATAIYGSRGANGVVLITTKGGSSGKMKIDYNAYIGKQTPFRLPKLLNAQQYMTTVNQLIDEGAAPVSNKVTGITGGGTDWLNQLGNTGPVIQSHDIAFSGGDNNTKYRVSLIYQNQPGLLINSYYKNYGARINLDQSLDSHFKTGLRMSYDYNDDRYLANGTGFNETAGALNAALNYDPTISVFDNNGNYNISPLVTVDNPLAIANGYTSYGDRYHFLGNMFGEYTFVPGLSLKLNAGAETFTEDRSTYISRISQYGLASGGIANLLHGSRSNFLSELTAHYNRNFGDVTVDAIAGTSYQKFINTNSLATGKGFPSDALGASNLALGNPTLATNSSYTANNKLLSYIGRANIGFLDRYLLTATLRVDGSSRFGVNTKFGYFPSFAGGWKISNEKFFAPLEKVFQEMKIRGSWGRTGNQAIGNYNSIPTYVVGPSAVMNDQLVSTVVPSRVPNPNLKWETTQQVDAGIDMSLLNGRISISADYYQKNTFDMLINLPIDLSTGFGTQLTNIGSMKNSGFEFNLTSNNFRGKFGWRTTANFSTIKNRVTGIGGLPQIYDGSAIIKVGLPLRSFYGYQVVGTWQTKDDLTVTRDPVKPGDPKYLDLNKDKTVNTADRVVLGNSFPKISYGLGNYFSYGKLDLSFFIDGIGGISKYNTNLAESLAPANIRRNRYAEPFLNRWTTSNPTNEWPSFVRQQGSFGVSTYTVTNASYLRLNNIQLGYDLSGSRLARWCRSLRVYVTAQNVAMISSYLGDPSVNTGGNANFNDSNNPYPQARSFLPGSTL